MLEFTEKLTLTPNIMTEQDVVGLRAHGFTDRNILSIILAAAYRNYIVRVADALGVELNPTVEYAPELIRAFGVDDRQARTTLYADRLARNDPRTKTAVTQRSQSPAQSPTNRICWIDIAPPLESTEEFQKARDELVKLSDATPLRNLTQTFALRPDALAVTVEYLRRVSLGGSGLGRRLESIICLVVAATLSSQYMGIYHAQRLLNDGVTLDDVKRLIGDPSEGAIEPRERGLACFCERLTRVPGTMVLSDVEALRAVGFTDRDIITIAASVSLENFLCRVADGVGLQLEPEPDMRAAFQAFQTHSATPS